MSGTTRQGRDQVPANKQTGASERTKMQLSLVLESSLVVLKKLIPSRPFARQPLLGQALRSECRASFDDFRLRMKKGPTNG